MWESSNVLFAVGIPEHWSDMKQQDVCVVQLQPGHAEYDTVASKFNQTCSHFYIEKVSLLLTWSFLRMVEMSGIMVLDKSTNTFATTLFSQN